jgi:hypothetical protein
MAATTSMQHGINATSDVASGFVRPIEAAIRRLEQRASDPEEAPYEALWEAGDAGRRAAELPLQALETRMRQFAVVECEPLDARPSTERATRKAVVQLTHVYFDEPAKYRVVIRLLEAQGRRVSDGADVPLWCSRVVYDAARPEGKCPITNSEAVHAVYRAAEQQGCRLTWLDPITR